MKEVFLKYALILCALGGVVGLIGDGCERKPTNPPPIEPGEHLFYVVGRFDGTNSLIRTFSVEKKAFIDSFTLDSFYVSNIAVAGDNEALYVGSANQGVRFYDIKSKSLLFGSTEYCCGGRISRDSKYYEAYSSGLRLFEVDGHHEVYYDSNGSSGGSFSHDSEYFLYKRDSNIIVYNLQNDSIENSFQFSRNGSFFRIYKIWPTVDMKKLFLIGNQGGLLYFAVTDFGGDTVRTLQAPLNTWGEDAAVSPDGKYLYIVNTPYTDYEPPRMKIDVYEVETEQLVTSISTQEYSYFEPQYISLTSDGKYLMATPWNLGGFDVLLIDARNFDVIGSYQFADQIIPEEISTKH